MFSKALSSYFDVISNPKKAFETIFAEKLPVWVPLVLVLLVTLAGTSLIFDQAIDMETLKLEYNPDIGEDEFDQTMQYMEKMKEPPMKYFGIAMPLIFIPVIFAISALLVLLGGNFIFGGKAKYGDVFKLIAYGSAISIVSWAAQLLVFYISGNAPTLFSPAAFLPLAEFYTATYSILAALDIFTLWSLAVTGFGISVLYKFDMTKSMAIPFGFYILYIVVFKLIF